MLYEYNSRDTIAKCQFIIIKRVTRVCNIFRKQDDVEEEENPGKYVKRPSIQDNQMFQRAVLNTIGSRASIRASVRASIRSRRGENNDNIA